MRRNKRFTSNTGATCPVEELAKQYCRTKTSIYRIINEMRAKRILELPLDFMPNPYFGRESAEKAIFGRDAAVRSASRRRCVCRAACRRIWPACTKCRC